MKVSVGSEMARNANENEFQTSKMATGEKWNQKLISDIQICRQWLF
jgi:hypothetical protein